MEEPTLEEYVEMVREMGIPTITDKERIGIMNKRIKNLENIILSISSQYHDGKICICDMRIGNPMCNDHSEACKKAREIVPWKK